MCIQQVSSWATDTGPEVCRTSTETDTLTTNGKGNKQEEHRKAEEVCIL